MTFDFKLTSTRLIWSNALSGLEHASVSLACESIAINYEQQSLVITKCNEQIYYSSFNSMVDENDVPIPIANFIDFATTIKAAIEAASCGGGSGGPVPAHTHPISEIINLQTVLNTKITNTELTNAINDLIGGAPAGGDTLKELYDLIVAINNILASNDPALDTVQELVDAIKAIQTQLSTYLVNDLVTGGTDKALTAEQGKVLKDLIDSIDLTITIVDDLVTGGTTDVLSAEQGKVLKGLIDEKTSYITSGRGKKTTNMYLECDGEFSNIRPFIADADMIIRRITATSASIKTWDAEIHDDYSLIPGAVVSLSANKSETIDVNIPVLKGAQLMFFCKGTLIESPGIVLSVSL